MDIRVNMTPVIDYEEIECALDTPIENFAFYRRADHTEGYFWINTDEDAIPDLENSIQEERELAIQFNFELDENAISRMKNDIRLITELRAMGFTDGVLIYIWY